MEFILILWLKAAIVGSGLYLLREDAKADVKNGVYMLFTYGIIGFATTLFGWYVFMPLTIPFTIVRVIKRIKS